MAARIALSYRVPLRSQIVKMSLSGYPDLSDVSESDDFHARRTENVKFNRL